MFEMATLLQWLRDLCMWMWLGFVSFFHYTYMDDRLRMICHIANYYIVFTKFAKNIKMPGNSFLSLSCSYMQSEWSLASINLGPLGTDHYNQSCQPLNYILKFGRIFWEITGNHWQAPSNGIALTNTGNSLGLWEVLTQRFLKNSWTILMSAIVIWSFLPNKHGRPI